MAKKVKSVDWAKLAHRSGPATQVPRWLENLRNPDPRWPASTYEVLSSMMWSESAWFSAQPKFVEALFDLAANPEVPGRDRLLDFSTSILTRGTGSRVHQGLDFNDPAVKALYAEGLGAELHAVFLAHLPLLVGSLASEDPALRAAAAESLAFVFEATSSAFGPLIEAIGREREEPVLGTMLLALGLFIRYSGERARRAVLDEHAKPGRPLMVRACATAATLTFDPAAYTPSVFALFAEAMDVPDPPPEQFPFTGGKLDALLYQCVLDVVGKPELEKLRRATLERGTATGAPWSRLVEAVIATQFQQAAYATRSDFTPEQLATLELLSRREAEAPFHYLGVPATLSTRRRWLELDPPGPLNWPVEVAPRKGRRELHVGVIKFDGEKHTWPIWRALLTAEEGRDARPSLLRDHFSPLQILAIFEDYVFLEGEAEFTEMDCGEEVFIEAVDRAGAEALPWAIAATERLSSHPRLVGPFGNLSLLPIVRSLGKGEMLDPRHDPAVCPQAPPRGKALAVAREVLARVPLERREAIFLRDVAGHPGLERLFVPTLELCPTPRLATYLLEALDGKHMPGGAADVEAVDVKAVLPVLVKVARKHPDVAAVLKGFAPESKLLKGELKKALKELKG